MAVCLLLAAPAVAAPPSRAQRPAPPADQLRRYIVVLDDEADPRSVIADHAGVARAGRRYQRVFNGFTVRTTPEGAAALAADARVEAVEADGWMQRMDAQGWPTWGLDRIDQPSRNLDNTYAYSTRGRGVSVYVVDGGVYARHREFGDRVAKGFDVTGNGAQRDCDGHGTHVAGTVGGRRFGVAKKVRIVPVRVMGCSQYIRRSDVIAGLDYIVRHHRRGRPAVANLSLGGPASAVADRAVNRVIDDGVTVVTAAGNQGGDACAGSPGRVRRVITVAAVNRRNYSPNWSNYGPCVDVFAPGVDILSAGISSRTASRRLSGTSMASPHVAGAAARFLSAHPSAGPRVVTRHLLSAALPGADNAGWRTTTRMLYVPGRVPTTLSIRQSHGSVDPDDTVTLRTRLRNRVTDAPLRGRTVALQARRRGAATWNTVARPTTNDDGRAASTQRPGRAMEYRWRHDGSRRTARAASSVAGVGFRRWQTNLAFVNADNLVGALTTDTGKALQGLMVTLWQRPQTSGEWVFAASGTTNDSGRVDFSAYELPAVQFQMRHAGTNRTRRATSATELGE